MGPDLTSHIYNTNTNKNQDDALDVVEMLQESLLDAFTTEAGEVDFAHHSGSMSLAKQVSGCRHLCVCVCVCVCVLCVYVCVSMFMCVRG